MSIISITTIIDLVKFLKAYFVTLSVSEGSRFFTEPVLSEILPLHFVQGFGSLAQNDKKQRVQNDIEVLQNAVAKTDLVKWCYCAHNSSISWDCFASLAMTKEAKG